MNELNPWEKAWRAESERQKVPPPPAAWEQIAPQLPQKEKKRRFGFWWWTTAGVFLIGAGVAWALLLPGVETNQSLPSSTKPAPTTSTNTAPSVVQQRLETQLPTETQHQESGPAHVTDNDKEEANGVVLDATMLQKRNKMQRSSPPAIRSTQANESEMGLPPAVLPTNHQEPTLTEPSTASTPVDLEKDAEASALAFLLSREMVPGKPGFKWDKVLCPDFRRKSQLKPFVEVELGMGYPFKQLQATTEFAYLEQRHAEYLQPVLSWHGGLRAGLEIFRNFTLSAGAQYSEYKENFRQVLPGIVKIEITIDNTGPIQQTDTVITRGTLFNTATNTYRLLDIPLLLGYRVGRGRWKAGLEAGALINYRLYATGKTVNDMGQAIIYRESPYFKKQLTWSAQGSVLADWALNARMHLYGKAGLRYFPGTWSNRPAVYSQLRYHQAFAALGLRYYL
jgi:hypothetical protein